MTLAPSTTPRGSTRKPPRRASEEILHADLGEMKHQRQRADVHHQPPVGPERRELAVDRAADAVLRREQAHEPRAAPPHRHQGEAAGGQTAVGVAATIRSAIDARLGSQR